MASLLVDLHRAGVYWGDCSLANTLFRRDGDKIQAYLVDAETSEIHPALSDGQRAYDLDILVENVAFGLADLGAMQGRDGRLRRRDRGGRDGPDPLHRGVGRAPPRAGAVARRPARDPGPDPAAQRSRLRRRRDLARADLGRRRARSGSGSPSPTAGSTPASCERLTGLVALEGQARLLLNDLHEYQAWIECRRGRPITTGGRRRALARRGPRAGARRRWCRRSARCATRSRPTATCSSRSGCCPRRPATTSASRRRWPPTSSSGRRRPRPGRRSRTARSRSTSTGRAASTRTRQSA